MTFFENPLPSRPAAWLAAIAFCFAGLNGCKLGFENLDDGSDDEDEEVSEPTAYVGSGSAWLLEIDDDAFDLKIRARPADPDLTTVTGDYEDLASGFSRLTVADATGDNQPAQGRQMAALVLEENLLLLNDWINSDRLMPFIPEGECPTEDFSANWIQLLAPSGNLADDENTAFFGALDYSVELKEIKVSSQHALTEGYPQPALDDALSAGNCDQGYSTQDGNNVFFGDKGSALIRQTGNGTGDSLWLALPSTRLTNVDLDGSYIGFWADTTRNGDDQLWPVTAECVDGTCPVKRVSDISDLVSTGDEDFTITLDLSAQEGMTEGFVTGIAEIPAAGLSPAVSGRIGCIASHDFNDTGAKLFVCVGQAPSNPQLTVHGFFIAK